MPQTYVDDTGFEKFIPESFDMSSLKRHGFKIDTSASNYCLFMKEHGGVTIGGQYSVAEGYTFYLFLKNDKRPEKLKELEQAANELLEQTGIRKQLTDLCYAAQRRFGIPEGVQVVSPNLTLNANSLIVRGRDFTKAYDDLTAAARIFGIIKD